MDNGEITQRGIEDFREVQEYMILAKEENTTKTYAKFCDKLRYLMLFHTTA